MLEKKSHGVQLHFKHLPGPKNNKASAYAGREEGGVEAQKATSIPDNSDSGYLGTDGPM
jgi:hypothetical protein